MHKPTFSLLYRNTSSYIYHSRNDILCVRWEDKLLLTYSSRGYKCRLMTFATRFAHDVYFVLLSLLSFIVIVVP